MLPIFCAPSDLEASDAQKQLWNLCEEADPIPWIRTWRGHTGWAAPLGSTRFHSTSTKAFLLRHNPAAGSRPRLGFVVRIFCFDSPMSLCFYIISPFCYKLWASDNSSENQFQAEAAPWVQTETENIQKKQIFLISCNHLRYSNQMLTSVADNLLCRKDKMKEDRKRGSFAFLINLSLRPSRTDLPTAKRQISANWSGWKQTHTQTHTCLQYTRLLFGEPFHLDE